MFFDKLQALCDEKGIAMSALLDQVGMSRGNMARWKDGLTPKPATQIKLAEALGVDRERLTDSEIVSDNAKMIFAENLKTYIDRKGLTQLDVAKYMECSSSTVSDWCNGRKYPRVDKMQRLADWLGVQMSDLTSKHDPLDDVDIAFYGDYKELSEDDKAVLRDMVAVMRARRAKKNQED